MLERNSGRYVLRGRKSTAGSEGGPRVGPRISFDVGEGRKETSNATDPDPRRGPHDRRDAGIGRGRGPRRASDDERSERKHGGYVRDGLVPNHFPEGSQEAVYNTADASLWYHLASVEADLGLGTEAATDVARAFSINPFLTVRDLPAARALAARLGVAP